MQKIAIVGAMLLLAACAAPNPAPLPPSGPIPAADRYAFTKLDQKTCPTEARNFADWVERYEAFGCAGQAAKIKPQSLEKMFSRYEKGELAQKVV